MIAVGLLAGALALVILGLSQWIQRRARARFDTSGALAEALADADGRLHLVLPAGPAVELNLEYGMRASTPSGGGIRYGMYLTLEIERGDLATRADYALGNAPPRATTVSALERGPELRSGLDISRTLLLLRVPAGGAGVVRGRLELTTGACTVAALYARAV